MVGRDRMGWGRLGEEVSGSVGGGMGGVVVNKKRMQNCWFLRVLQGIRFSATIDYQQARLFCMVEAVHER